MIDTQLGPLLGHDVGGEVMIVGFSLPLGARVALVAAVLLAGAAALAAASPMSSPALGADCGSALSPRVQDDQRVRARGYADELTGDETPSLDGGNAADLRAGVVALVEDCDAAVRSRRQLVLRLAAALVLVPLVLFGLGTLPRRGR